MAPGLASPGRPALRVGTGREVVEDTGQWADTVQEGGTDREVEAGTGQWVGTVQEVVVQMGKDKLMGLRGTCMERLGKVRLQSSPEADLRKVG